MLSGHCEEEVNLVNAPSLAEERGIAVSERSETVARDFTDLVRLTIVCGADRYRVAGTTLGRRNRPHLLEAWGQRFNLQLDEGAHLALFRYPNRPGMLGRVGSLLGERGINISSATQGVQRTDDELNVVIVVTDAGIPDDGDARGAVRAGRARRPQHARLTSNPGFGIRAVRGYKHPRDGTAMRDMFTFEIAP